MHDMSGQSGNILLDITCAIFRFTEATVSVNETNDFGNDGNTASWFIQEQ